MMTKISHEDALQLMQASGYDEYDQDYYRCLVLWIGLSPYRALCRIIYERGWESVREKDKEDQQP